MLEVDPTQPRPEWSKCVAAVVGSAHDLYKKTWCGRPLYGAEWVFTSVEHAALNGRAQDRLVCCPECLVAIVEALSNGYKITK